MKIIKDVFTGADNETFDVSRLMLFLCVVAHIFFTGYQLFNRGIFDGGSFSGGCAALLFGGGAGIWIKRDSEPIGTKLALPKNTYNGSAHNPDN